MRTRDLVRALLALTILVIGDLLWVRYIGPLEGDRQTHNLVLAMGYVVLMAVRENES